MFEQWPLSNSGSPLLIRANMRSMKSLQIIVAVLIVVVGGGGLAGEYILVKWWPVHKEAVTEKTLELLPYRNEGMGIEMQIAAGIYGKIRSFPGGVRIYRPKIIGSGPSITITALPSPDHSFEFRPQDLAVWQTDGIQKNIANYRFEHTQIMNRDAVLIWQPKNRRITETLRVIAPDRVIQADCTAADETNEALYLQACDSSLRTMKLAGPEPPPPTEPGVQEIPGPPIR
jgi:hypothetical protein